MKVVRNRRELWVQNNMEPRATDFPGAVIFLNRFAWCSNLFFFKHDELLHLYISFTQRKVNQLTYVVVYSITNRNIVSYVDKQNLRWIQVLAFKEQRRRSTNHYHQLMPLYE